MWKVRCGPALTLALIAACSGAPSDTSTTSRTIEPIVLPTTSTSSTTPPEPPAMVRTSSGPGPTWEAVSLPEGVAAGDGAMVWTGRELIFWGGEDTSRGGVATGDPGMAYNPQAGTWRTLPVSTMAASYGVAGVWTGDEVLVCCSPGFPVAAAAYDPTADRWRPLADPPPTGESVDAVWTGEEMLVVSDVGVAGYRPTTDTWRIFPDPPVGPGRTNAVAWTGTELVVWPADVARTTSLGTVLEPETGVWRILPQPPAHPAAPDIAWTGEELIIWGGLPAAGSASERAVGSRLDWGTGEWTALPEPLPEPDGCECNLGSQTMVWMGGRLLVATGAFGTGVDPTDPLLLAYDPGGDGWTLVGEAPPGWGAEALVAGDRVVFRSDRLYLVEIGWRPVGTPIPPAGLAAVARPPVHAVPGLATGDPGLAGGANLTVAATNGQSAISVLDLRSGGRTDYDGRHTAGGDALDLTVSGRGDVIVWNTGPAKLYRGDADGERLLSELAQPPMLLGGLEGAVHPTDDGNHAWIWGHPTTLEYVDTTTGELLLRTEIPDGYQPAFAAGDDLVVTDDRDRIAVVDTLGTVTPHSDGAPLEGTDDVIVHQPPCERACTLVISSRDDPAQRVSVALPEGATTWDRAGRITIPSTSPDLPTVTRNGRLLIGDAASGSGPDVVHRVTVIDLVTGATDVVAEYEGTGFSSAFWSRDGTDIVVLTNGNTGNDVTVIDGGTGRRHDLAGALPDGYWVLGAG